MRAVASLLALSAGIAAATLRPAPDGASALPAPRPQSSVEPIAPYIALLTAAPSASEQDGVAAMERGLARLRAEDGAGARSAFLEAARLLPELEDWALLHAASATALLGDTAGVAELLERIDPWLARERGWRPRIAALRRSGATEHALPIALEAAQGLGAPERRAQALLEVAQIQLVLRDSVAALDALRRAIAEAPSADVALTAARALSALPGTSPADDLLIGRLYARHGNHARALAGLDRFVSSGRGAAEERAAVRTEAARELFDARRYAEVERRLAGLVSEPLPDSLAAEAMLLLGRAQYRQGKVTAARARLLGLGETHPQQRATAEALYIVGDLDHDDGRMGVARDLYTRALAAMPAASHAGDAAMRLGGLLLTSGEPEAAARVFEQYHASHATGDRRQQAAYWSARARLAAGDSVAALPFLREAVSLDPVSWYGLRAADLLGIEHWTQTLAPAPASDAEAQLEADGALRRLALLDRLALRDAFDLELARLRERMGGRLGTLYAIAEGLHEQPGQLLTAVLLGRELKRNAGRWDTRLLRIVYPFPYRNEIMAQAEIRGLDPFLVAGLIRQESLFNPIARSSAGAVGLMQVRPPTGRELARRDGVRGFNAAQLRTPAVNLRLGTLFFADLLRRYDGRVGYVLAAYNAGPSRLARWRQLPEATDPDLFAERIPFRETREYVKVVQQNARIYRELYGE